MTAELACAVLSYRDEPFLVEAVRSVLDQSEPVEVVVVNSGGGKPAERLAAAGLDVPVFSFERRLLPGGARNVGLDRTRAPHVSFLAADCLALPGWAAGRLREHRAGAAAVASVPANAYPDSTSAWASLLLLHNRRLAVNTPSQRLLYSLSYDRSLFARFGRFREELRAGEDTEFNARLRAHVRIALAGDVRTAHRYPTDVRAMLADAFRRGRLQACAAGALAGTPPPGLRVASRGPRNAARALLVATRMPEPERRCLYRAWPLAAVGAAVYAAGAASATPATAVD